MLRLFPNTYVVTELSQASNMRFMQFSAQDVYSQKASRLEQVSVQIQQTKYISSFGIVSWKFQYYHFLGFLFQSFYIFFCPVNYCFLFCKQRFISDTQKFHKLSYYLLFNL